MVGQAGDGSCVLSDVEGSKQMGPWRIRGFPVRSGRLLELDPPVFSHAPPQGQHVSAKEIKIPVSKCTKEHGILECHGSSIPASLYVWETELGE